MVSRSETREMEQPKKSLIIDRILERISFYVEREVTGKIAMKLPSQETVAIYLNLGFIAWVSDEIHSQRRWERSLKHSGISLDKIQLMSDFIKLEAKKTDLESNWGYDDLVHITKQNLLNKEQVKSIISYIGQEILFDLSQKAQQQRNKNSQLPLSIEFHPTIRPSEQNFLPYTWLCSLSNIATSTRKTYQQWLALGLIKYSPNLIPVISDYKKLSRKVNLKTYQNLVYLLNGENSFREIANKMERDLITITQPLSDLIKEGFIKCANPQEKTVFKTSTNLRKAGFAKTSEASPLQVAAIDDSPHSLKLLEHIVTYTKNHWTGISNPLEALPILLENPPDLIFLDLMMPVMNGYELCGKIRKVNTLKTVPIIILSGNLISKVRGKLMGATEFLEKPIITHKVVNLIHYYQQQKTEQNTIPSQVPVKRELQSS